MGHSFSDRKMELSTALVKIAKKNNTIIDIYDLFSEEAVLGLYGY
ncbi:MAG: hypothetical protein CM15mP109_09580 [Candidatus Dadabacteria bacterium]|nr:MAG: hypothetical protein CM15mP109_09580 [Candidatus Dadabacteria bacterium]